MNTLSPGNEPQKKVALLFIVRYPGWAIPFAFLSMAIFRLPLWLNSRLSFWRLMGSGRNGTFDIIPDLKQWAILAIISEKNTESFLAENNIKLLIKKTLGNFIKQYILIFSRQVQCILLQPEEGHGLWNGKEVFGSLPKSGSSWTGPIAVLTRATIRLSKARSFWKHVDTVASQMATADGFITSYGIGEAPLIKQATFSVWQSKQAMHDFAYKMPKHKEVIRKTHQEKWYSEDMFVRFRLLKVWNFPALAALADAAKAAPK